MILSSRLLNSTLLNMCIDAGTMTCYCNAHITLVERMPMIECFNGYLEVAFTHHDLLQISKPISNVKNVSQFITCHCSCFFVRLESILSNSFSVEACPYQENLEQCNLPAVKSFEHSQKYEKPILSHLKPCSIPSIVLILHTP